MQNGERKHGFLHITAIVGRTVLGPLVSFTESSADGIVCAEWYQTAWNGVAD